MVAPVRSLRVAVADDELDTREYFQELLPRLGHEVVVMAETGRQLVERCRAVRPDLVIADIKMPDMDGIEAADAINRERQVPVILVTAQHDPDIVLRSGADHIMAYLTKPIRQADLATAIHLAVLRFEHFLKLIHETTNLRQALEDRKVIERAKGVLMKRGHMEESEAFRRLQKLASDKNRKLIDVAQMVLIVEEALREDDGPSRK